MRSFDTKLRKELQDAPLGKHEQALVPEHRQLLTLPALRLVRVRETDEVEDEGIDDLIRERVLLVEQDANEERVRAWKSYDYWYAVCGTHICSSPA